MPYAGPPPLMQHPLSSKHTIFRHLQLNDLSYDIADVTDLILFESNSTTLNREFEAATSLPLTSVVNNATRRHAGKYRSS